MSAGLLFSQMQPPAGWEEEFHDWYESEHIPVRMAIPGFERAVRYELSKHEGGPEAARWLACYFLDDVAALRTPGYARLKSDPGERTRRMLGNVEGFTRYICDQLSDTGPVGAVGGGRAEGAGAAAGSGDGGGGGSAAGEPGAMLAIAFDVPEHEAEEFNGWYEEEHVPLLMHVPGWLRVRRYAVRPGFDGPPWTHIAIHELASEEALSRPERAAARDTPRRARLAERDWFTSGRWVYRPIHHATATHAQAA